MKSARFDDSNENYQNHIWDAGEKRWLPKTSLNASEAKQPNGEPTPEFTEDGLAESLKFAAINHGFDSQP